MMAAVCELKPHEASRHNLRNDCIVCLHHITAYEATKRKNEDTLGVDLLFPVKGPGIAT